MIEGAKTAQVDAGFNTRVRQQLVLTLADRILETVHDPNIIGDDELDVKHRLHDEGKSIVRLKPA